MSPTVPPPPRDATTTEPPAVGRFQTADTPGDTYRRQRPRRVCRSIRASRSSWSAASLAICSCRLAATSSIRTGSVGDTSRLGSVIGGVAPLVLDDRQRRCAGDVDHEVAEGLAVALGGELHQLLPFIRDGRAPDADLSTLAHLRDHDTPSDSAEHHTHRTVTATVSEPVAPHKALSPAGSVAGTVGICLSPAHPPGSTPQHPGCGRRWLPLVRPTVGATVGTAEGTGTGFPQECRKSAA